MFFTRSIKFMVGWFILKYKPFHGSAKREKNKLLGENPVEQGVIKLIYKYNQSGYSFRILDYANFPAFLRAVMAIKELSLNSPISRVRK